MAKLVYNWSCERILLEFMVTFCAWRLVQRINLAVVLLWYNVFPSISIYLSYCFDPPLFKHHGRGTPSAHTIYFLLSWWTYMSSWKPWIGHYNTLRKKNINNWIMFPFMGYGIMFPFIIFIIHMIFSLSYFGSLSGSYFVWKSTFIFLFFNFEFMYLLIILDMDSLS